MDRAFVIAAAQIVNGALPGDLRGFPPRQKAASFTVDQAMEKLEASFPTGQRGRT